jgi:hypothetical protein
VSADHAASILLANIFSVSATLFPCRFGCLDPRGTRWWDDECSATLMALTTAPAGPERHAASSAFCYMVWSVKRRFFNDLLDHTTSTEFWRACA